MKIIKFIVLGQFWINLPMLLLAYIYAVLIFSDFLSLAYITTTFTYITVSFLYWAYMSPKYQLFVAKKIESVDDFKKFKALANKSCLLCDKNFLSYLEIWTRSDKDFINKKFYKKN